jgi:phenylalanyl-tRNA synthetase beta chain
LKISLDWVRDYVDLPTGISPAELAHELTLKTVEVEDVIAVGAAYGGIVAARVEAVERLGDGPVTQVRATVGDDRTVALVTRVTGIVPGALIAVALPGARLRHADGRPIEVVPSEILGVTSEGVVCTAADVQLDRLMRAAVPDAALDLSELGVRPGTPLADALLLNDTVFEIDNKSLTNRPDLWGHYGIAREFAAIYDVPLRPLPLAPTPPAATDLIGDVDAAFCRRFSAVEFEVTDDTVEAPLWIRSRLARIGENSINVCVDLSAYVMFTVGQPTHVYDADRVELPLNARTNGTSTKLDVLSGTVHLAPDTSVITDRSGPVAVAGVIGSAGSAVRTGSRRFVLEAATFEAPVIRRSSQYLGVRTEASARFEKGLDTQRVDPAIDLFLVLLDRIAPQATTVRGRQDVDPEPTVRATVTVGLDFLGTRVGMPFDGAQVKRSLDPLGFATAVDGDTLRATAPTWRSTGDISLPQDIVEEVARIYGYDNLPTSPLSVSLKPVTSLHRTSVDRAVRETLALVGGMREVLTYPWVSDAMLAASGGTKDRTVRFEGAPAPDRDSLRPSLVPNLLAAAETNLPYTQAFGIFEVGTVFAPGEHSPTPIETRVLGGLLVGSDGATLFRQAKGMLEMLRDHGHLADLDFGPGGEAAWADPSARLTIVASGRTVGVLALVTPRTKRLANIASAQVACFELDLGGLELFTSRHNSYAKLAEFPESDFDLSLVVDDAVTWGEIAAEAGGVESVHDVAFVDEFRGDWVPTGQRSLTLRVILRSDAGTLTSQAIAATRDRVLDTLANRVGARLRA